MILGPLHIEKQFLIEKSVVNDKADKCGFHSSPFMLDKGYQHAAVIIVMV